MHPVFCKHIGPALIITLLLSIRCHAQFRLWGELGYSISNMKSMIYGVDNSKPWAQRLTYHSIYVGVRADQYLNYNFALTSGLFYWENGYETKFQKFWLEENVLMPDSFDEIWSLSGVNNEWKNSFAQIPIGLKYSPIGKRLTVAVGSDLNVLLRSTFTDVTDTLNHHLRTDVTKAFRRVWPDVFLSLGYRASRFSFNIKVFRLLGEMYSVNARNAVVNNAIDHNANVAPFYYSLGRAPLKAGLCYHFFIGYRIL